MQFSGKQERSRAKPEFQAIILAGIGSRLEPLVSPHGDNPTPKALLPILNKPLVSYVLSWLEEAEIKDALIVCPPGHVAALTDHLQSSSPTLKVELHAFEADIDVTNDTVPILQKISSRIHSDFIVLACDFVPSSSLPLTKLLNQWRDDTGGMIMASLFYEVEEKSLKTLGLALPRVLYKDSTLLHVVYDDKKQEEIPMRLLNKFGNCRVTKRLADSHVYIFKKTVLDILSQLPQLHSIREDLVPFLCSLQYSVSKRNKFSDSLTHSERITSSQNVQEKGSIHSLTAIQYSTIQNPGIFQMRPLAREKRPKSPALPSWFDPDHISEGSSDVDSTEIEPRFFPTLECGILVHRFAENDVCGRATTLATYREINRALLVDGLFNSQSPNDGIDPKAQISSNALISTSARIGENSILKKSVVGQHCIIGKNVRIVNSVIMEHVHLADGVKVENCVLSRHTRVLEGTELQDCESTPGAEVLSNSSYKGVRLDGTEAIKAMSAYI